MEKLLEKLGIGEVNHGATTGGSDGWIKCSGPEIVSINPSTGKPIARVVEAGEGEYEALVSAAEKGFKSWRSVPAPKRGEVVREIGEALRNYKTSLGDLVSLEMGKIRAEGAGEVQEMIDMADFSVGLSRQLHGLTMHSERPFHRMYEQWHPLGPVGIITAFNFPVAVWSWNALVGSVCGDVLLWKPSSKTPLTSIAVQNIIAPVLDRHGVSGVFSMMIGSGKTIGEKMIADKRVPLVSATGSCRMGRRIASVVGARLGRTLLELGGNNAVIVCEDADLELARRAIVFGSVGTAGQRCTSTRRLIVHKNVREKLLSSLVSAYKQVGIGDPMAGGTLMGPLVDRSAVEDMMAALERAKSEGCRVVCGGEVHVPEDSLLKDGFFVTPAIVEADVQSGVVMEETFAPILYILTYEKEEDAIAIHNQVPQGLSSSIFTDSISRQELFLSHMGSDCGIANVNIGTSGAEIGGAFGGEKDTGGGRESGSDAWKIYMRRQTNTINWGRDLPLAQGIRFE